MTTPDLLYFAALSAATLYGAGLTLMSIWVRK
jgi:hypothetical protein